MITKTRQNWEVGKFVKVGFLNLKITGIIPTTGDFRPDIYELINAKGDKKYNFTPHYGIERVN